jgi:hypothetical protein
VVAVLGGGLLVLLGLNTALAQGSFRLSDLQRQVSALDDQQQALQERVAVLAATKRLASQARALGMVATTDPVFLRASDAKVLGHAAPAAGAPAPAPAPVAPTPSPSAADPTAGGSPGTGPLTPGVAVGPGPGVAVTGTSSPARQPDKAPGVAQTPSDSTPKPGTGGEVSQQ